MPLFQVPHCLAIVVLVSLNLSVPGSAQNAGVLPPLFGVMAGWDTPPETWAEAFRAAGWAIVPGRAGAVTTHLEGAWAGSKGVLTIYPGDSTAHVRSFDFEGSIEGPDSASVRALFLDLIDSLTTHLGPPTGWGLGGLYQKDRVLALGILETVWRKAGSSGDYLTLEAVEGKLKLSIRSAAYQAELAARSRAARLRWEAEKGEDGPVVSPNYVYEASQLTSLPMLTGCHEKPPATGYRGRLTITTVVAPWGRPWPLISLATLNAPANVRHALEDWINEDCGFVGGMIDGTFVYSRLTFTVSIDH